jgi:hypothetical protein
MGMFKDAKAAGLAKEAAKALEDGAAVFTPRLNFPATMHGLSGNVSDWAVMVSEVESVGWVLAHWSVAMDSKGRPEAYPVFRRA